MRLKTKAHKRFIRIDLFTNSTGGSTLWFNPPVQAYSLHCVCEQFMTIIIYNSSAINWDPKALYLRSVGIRQRTWKRFVSGMTSSERETAFPSPSVVKMKWSLPQLGTDHIISFTRKTGKISLTPRWSRALYFETDELITTTSTIYENERL